MWNKIAGDGGNAIFIILFQDIQYLDTSRYCILNYLQT